ncbi:MAG: 50S ribosomal protein L29 [Deltaproteobacteria bacterium]|nr:50S ribosomal protein L29 [Deltaproteobacteria bacterium]
MTPKELRTKSEVELKRLVVDLQDEHFKLTLQNSTGQLEKNHRLGELRREVARVHTILNEKKGQ